MSSFMMTMMSWNCCWFIQKWIKFKRRQLSNQSGGFYQILSSFKVIVYPKAPVFLLIFFCNVKQQQVIHFRYFGVDGRIVIFIVLRIKTVVGRWCGRIYYLYSYCAWCEWALKLHHRLRIPSLSQTITTGKSSFQMYPLWRARYFQKKMRLCWLKRHLSVARRLKRREKDAISNENMFVWTRPKTHSKLRYPLEWNKKCVNVFIILQHK